MSVEAEVLTRKCRPAEYQMRARSNEHTDDLSDRPGRLGKGEAESVTTNGVSLADEICIL